MRSDYIWNSLNSCSWKVDFEALKTELEANCSKYLLSMQNLNFMVFQKIFSFYKFQLMFVLGYSDIFLVAIGETDNTEARRSTYLYVSVVSRSRAALFERKTEKLWNLLMVSTLRVSKHFYYSMWKKSHISVIQLLCKQKS